MYTLVVSICHVAVRLRHVTSAKQKRSCVISLSDRLRALGFSVVECGARDNFKEAHIGLSCVGNHASSVGKVVDRAVDLLRAECEVIGIDRDLFTYEPSDSEDLAALVSPEDDYKD